MMFMCDIVQTLVEYLCMGEFHDDKIEYACHNNARQQQKRGDSHPRCGIMSGYHDKGCGKEKRCEVKGLYDERKV